jgi:hypothetical protein
MARSPKLNRRQFIRGGSAGLGALAGLSVAGGAMPAYPQAFGALKETDAIVARRKRYLETLQKILP